MPADPALPRHPVRITAYKSGVNPHVLRAWERRYGVVTPARSEGGQRLYSDSDIERLRILHRLTEQGHGIGQLARLPLEELERLDREEEASFETPRSETVSSEEASKFRSGAFKAAQSLDAVELQAVLERAAVSLGVPVFLDQVAAPSIREIGHGWREGTLTIGQEHLATTVFRRVLGWILETFDVSPPAARLLVATPAGQLHELGALLVAASAAIEGWDVVYVGADLPASEILRSARQAGAAAVALSIVRPTEDPALVEDLKTIRRGLGDDVPFFLGGAAVAQQPERFMAIGASLIDSLSEFRSELKRLQEDS